MSSLGFITSTQLEADAFLQYIPIKARVIENGYKIYFFEESGYEAVLIVSGKGTKNVITATQTLILEYSVQIIISFGVALGVGSKLQSSDVILTSQYAANGELEKQISDSLIQVPVHAFKILQSSLKKLNISIYEGTALLPELLLHKNTELETKKYPFFDNQIHDIIQVAAQNQIPVFSIRAISDHFYALSPNSANSGLKLLRKQLS